MTSRITTTRQMRGANLTVGDFRALFEGVSDDVVPDIRIEDGDRMGPETTSVTVVAGNALRSNQDVLADRGR